MTRTPRLSRVLLLVALVGPALAACSGDEDDTPLLVDPLPFEQYCDRYAQMTCDVAQQCDCLGGIGIDLCRAYQAAECHDDIEAPVQSGTNGYDAFLAGQCLRELEAIISDCSLEDAYWPAACDDMLPGQIARGGACGGDEECQGALECYHDVCTVMPRAGEACLEGSYCAADHFCGEDGQCHRYRGAGEPCPEGGVACDDDLYCDVRTSTCEPYLGVSASCAHDTGACDDDLYCSPSVQACAPYPGQGQSCVDSSGDCADGLYCDAAQSCQPQLPGGATCSDDEQCLSWDCPAGQCEPDTEPDCPFL